MAAGSIVVDLLMRTGSFTTDTQRASKAAQKAAREIESTFKQAGQAIAIGLAAAQTALTALVLKTTDTAKQIERFSQLANTSTQAFQYMAAGAAQFGIQQDKLSDILKDVQDKIGDFMQTGGGPLADFFDNIAPKVGVTAERFRKLSGPEALQLYVSSLQKANLSQSDMIFYMEALASDSSLLIPLLQNNGQEMKRFGDEAQRTGQIMSDDLIKQSKEFQQSIQTLTGILQGFGNMITAAVLPSLLKFSDELIAGRQATDGLIDAIRVLGFAKPFEDAGKGAKYYREQLESLRASRDAYIKTAGPNGSSLATFNRDIELAEKRLAYFRALELRQANRTAGADTQSDAEARRLGLTTLPTLSRAPMGNKKEKTPKDPYFDDWMKELQAVEDLRAAEIRMKIETNEALKKEDQAYDDWMNELRQAELDRYGDMLDKRLEEDRKAAEKTKEMSRQLGMTFTSAFEDAIVEGKKLSDVLRGLAQDILRITTRKLVTEPLGNALTSAIGEMFGGARAGGGDVIGGRSYLVGENGPEMFTPRTAGTITPNGATGGTTIVQNINVTTGVQQTVRAEIISLMPQIAGAAKAAVADAKLRGGSYAAALR